MKDLYILAIPIVAVLVCTTAAASPLWKGYKMRRAAKQPLCDDICVACSSPSLRNIAPGVYECLQCAFVGGSGMAAYAEEIRRQDYTKLSIADRTKRAIELLIEARNALLGAEGLLIDVSHLIRTSGEVDPAKHASMRTASGELLRVQRLLRESSELLQQSTPHVGLLGIDFSSLIYAVDENPLTHGMLTAAFVDAEIRKLNGTQKTMLQQVERLLGQLQP